MELLTGNILHIIVLFVRMIPFTELTCFSKFPYKTLVREREGQHARVKSLKTAMKL